MTSSFNRVVFSGATSRIAVPFPYLSKTDVSVSVGSTVLPASSYSWPTASEIDLGYMPTAGTLGSVVRTTSPDPLVTFTTGSLDVADLNAAHRQPLYRIQEVVDSQQEGGTGGVVSAQNRSDLALIDHTLFDKAILWEGGREGAFAWADGDYTVAVSSDTAQGVFVASATNPSGSLGAWVRTNRTALYMTWFGAVGDGAARPLSTQFATLAAAQRFYPAATSLTNQVNDMALERACLLAGVIAVPSYTFGPFDRAFPIFYPPGGWYHGTPKPMSGPIEIYGAGMGVSSLLFAGTAGFDITLPAASSFATIHNLDFLAVAPNAGTAISVSGTEDYTIRNSCNFHDIYIGSWGANYWNKGVFTQHLGDAHFVDIRCQSSPSDLANWMVAGFEVGTRCIDNHWQRCTVQGANAAVLVAGDYCEGVRIEDCSFISVRKGVQKTASVGNPPHFTIRGTHIASQNGCVDIQHVSTAIISDCLFYLTDQAGQPSAENSVCVYLDNCSGITFTNTEMGGQDPAPFQYGVLISNSINLKLDGLYFAFFDRAAWIQSTCSGGYFLWPRMFSCAAGVLNNSTTVLSLETITPFAKTILDDTSAAAVRTTLGIDASLGYTPFNKAGDGPINLSTGPGWNLIPSLVASVANSANAVIGAGSGLIFVNETTFSGANALFLVANGVPKLISQSGTLFEAGTASAGKIGLLVSGGSSILNNQTGSAVTMRMLTIKTRDT